MATVGFKGLMLIAIHIILSQIDIHPRSPCSYNVKAKMVYIC